jgi:hypothetical protein
MNDANTKLIMNEIGYLREDVAEFKKDVKSDVAEIKEDIKSKCINCSVSKIAKDRLLILWAAMIALGGGLWSHVSKG